MAVVEVVSSCWKLQALVESCWQLLKILDSCWQFLHFVLGTKFESFKIHEFHDFFFLCLLLASWKTSQREAIHCTGRGSGDIKANRKWIDITVATRDINLRMLIKIPQKVELDLPQIFWQPSRKKKSELIFLCLLLPSKFRGASGSAFSSRSDSDPQSAKMSDSDLLRESDRNPTQKLTTKVFLGIYLYFKYFKSILVSVGAG